MSLRISSAVPADVPIILRFVRELAAYEREPEAVVATEELMHAALFGEDRAACGLVARVDDQPVGYAIYFFNFSTWLGRPGLYLEDLYVTPSARQAGVGRALLTHLARVAVEKRCARMEWSVLDWNVRAIELYCSLGARPQKGWTVYRLTGDVLEDVARLAP